jgi:AhpD family alkylhydroperoxidase
MSHARLDYAAFGKIAPSAVAALQALSKTASEAGLEKELIELIKIRASQINGCAFCLQYHLTEARKAGVAAEKLDLAATWPDAGIFSEREQAALKWTETLTRLAENGAPEEVYAAVRKHFNETETAFLTVAIGTINAWNRIGVGLSFPPTIPKRN